MNAKSGTLPPATTPAPEPPPLPPDPDEKPEMRMIPASGVLKIVAALEAGIEYTEECIRDHDERLGRDTRKNAGTARLMEEDLKQMNQALTIACSDYGN